MRKNTRKKEVVCLLLGLLLAYVGCLIFSGLCGLLSAGDVGVVFKFLLGVALMGACVGVYLLLKRITRYDKLLLQLDIMAVVFLLYLIFTGILPSALGRIMDGSQMLVLCMFPDNDGLHGQLARFVSALNISCNILVVALFGLIVWHSFKRMVVHRCLKACEAFVQKRSKAWKDLFYEFLEQQHEAVEQ